MAKAAIEIPDDYLAGLRRCADTEKGDLSSFVIKAMLENYEAAKEDRRAMCGDTGLPRWYVKIGNEARSKAAPIALEAALRRATAHATTSVPCGPTACTRCGAPTTTIMSASARRRSNMRFTRRRLDRLHHRAQRRPVRFRLPHAVSGRRHRGRYQAVLLDTLIGFGKRGLACQPAIVGVGLGGSKDTSMVLGKQASCLRVVGSAQSGPTHRRARRGVQGARQLDRHGGHGLRRLFDGDRLAHIEVGYCHTGGMPMSVHMFCLRRAVPVRGLRPAAKRPFAPTRCGSPTTCVARPSNGAARRGGG